MVPHSDIGNLAYAVARVKTRKRFLLKREDYLKMLGMEPSAIARFIGESQYAEDVQALGRRFSGADLIEYAIYAHLARTYAEVLGFCRGRMRARVGGYMRRWDVYNIKTAMRGRLYGEDPARLALSFVPAGLLKRECLVAIASAGGVDDIIEALGQTEYHDILAEERRGPDPVYSLARLENALDRQYYAGLAKRSNVRTRADGAFLAFVRREIDIINLRNVLSLKREEVEPQAINEYVLRGGLEVSGQTLASMISADGFDATLAAIERLSFYDEVRPFVAGAKQSLIPLERSLEKYIARSARSFSFVDPLSPLPVIDYILNKKIEVDNIRIIVRGKERGMDESRVRDLLMLR
jgi:V/A-type H+-transporting ATPase subunit C